MEEDDQTFINKFIFELDAEVLSAHMNKVVVAVVVVVGLLKTKLVSMIVEDVWGTKLVAMTVEDVRGRRLMGIIWRKCLGHWTRGDT